METPRDLGLEFEAERDGVVTIRAVDAGGEGEAVGLIVGDVIDGIDGLPGGTVEEKIVELCDDSRELRATVMRICRGGVVMAVELFAAHDGAEASVMAWMRSLPAAAADAAGPARAREEEPIEPALTDVSPIFDDAQTPFGPRSYPNMPERDRQFFENLGRGVSYQAADYDWFQLPDRGAI